MTTTLPESIRPRVDTMLYASQGRWVVLDPLLGPERVELVQTERIHVNATQPPLETVLRMTLWSPQTQSIRCVFRGAHEPAVIVAALDAD